jgi:hypothetical protein
VFSVAEDFPTCESMRMLLQVDENGERNLVVVIVVNKVPKGLMDVVNRGLGCVYARKKVEDKLHEEARKREAKLFISHPGLNMLNKSMMGIHVLAKRLV